eukprot:5062027-Pyramimonas_sp.AAC.1
MRGAPTLGGIACERNRWGLRWISPQGQGPKACEGCAEASSVPPCGLCCGVLRCSSPKATGWL